MKQNWLIFLVLVFVLGSVVAAQVSTYYVRTARNEQDQLRKRLTLVEDQARRAAREQREYKAIEQLAKEVLDRVQWESNPTTIIRHLTEAGEQSGLHVVQCRLAPTDRGGVVMGAYQRQRFEMSLRGPFWPLVQCIDRIEQSASPMLVDSLSLTAAGDPGQGELKLTVSSLSPLVKPAPAPAAVAAVPLPAKEKEKLTPPKKN